MYFEKQKKCGGLCTMLHSQLLSETVQLTSDQHLLVINSAADPFVRKAAQQLRTSQITLAEDNIAALPIEAQSIASLSNTTTNEGKQNSVHLYRHIPFHKYVLCEP